MAISGINNDSSNYFSSMLQTKSSSSASSSSGSIESLVGAGTSSTGGLGDYALIRNGAYKKLLNAYYNKKPTEDTAAQKKEKINLTTSSADAGSLNTDISKLIGYEVNEDNRESIKDSLKSVIDKYNSVIDSASNVDDVKVLRQAMWMTQDTSALAASLSDIGITVGSNNKLSLNEEKFDNARLSSLNTVLKGKDSYFGRLSDRSAAINNAAANAVSKSSSKSLYKSSGDYAKQVSGNVVDKTE